MLANEPRTKSDRNRVLTNWANLLFNMSIAIAHEMMHMLVDMISGSIAVKTPPTIHWDEDEVEGPGNLSAADRAWIASPDWSAIPYRIGERAFGESGFVWEGLAMGGKTSFVFDPNLCTPGIPNERTSGHPYLV
jgi:hypothetical protein